MTSTFIEHICPSPALKATLALTLLAAAMLFAVQAPAQSPAVPIGPSSLADGVIPLGPGVGVLPIGPTNGAGGGAPSSCSNSLDFSQACNSQYINVVGL